MNVNIAELIKTQTSFLIVYRVHIITIFFLQKPVKKLTHKNVNNLQIALYRRI